MYCNKKQITLQWKYTLNNVQRIVGFPKYK